MTSSAVLVMNHGAVAVIRMNRPKTRNALDAELQAGLSHAIHAVCRDESVRAVVLSGADGSFCSGGDLRGLAASDATEEDALATRDRIRTMHEWFVTLLDCEKPAIAAVGGAAFGAGLSLALACDFVIADVNAAFCSVFARVGYVPDLAQMYLLPRRVGLSAAKDMAFTGRVVRPEESLAMGLVNTLVGDGKDVEAEAVAYAARFAPAPTAAIGMTKAIMNRAFESDREDVLRSEAMMQALCRKTDFHREAVRRFVAKEPLQYVWEK